MVLGVIDRSVWGWFGVVWGGLGVQSLLLRSSPARFAVLQITGTRA